MRGKHATRVESLRSICRQVYQLEASALNRLTQSAAEIEAMIDENRQPVQSEIVDLSFHDQRCLVEFVDWQVQRLQELQVELARVRSEILRQKQKCSRAFGRWQALERIR